VINELRIRQNERVGNVRKFTAVLPDYESVILSLTPATVCLILVSVFSAAVNNSYHPNSVYGCVMECIAL
jgi:hypothetical protein